ncbi:MAG: hypothetical protein LUG46_08610 [Erysipelotrichaceae bacterium]|nr:hypothetical protein [Erysipelotrichaceae bacterium]
MLIQITRDNICQTDNNHTMTYYINETTQFTDIFLDLINQHYFPETHHVVWTLTCKNNDIASWITDNNQIYTCFPFAEPNILNVKYWKDIKVIHFQYFDSPIKRAEYIYKKFNGQMGIIGHEGYMNEYLAYHVDKQLEESWGK